MKKRSIVIKIAVFVVLLIALISTGFKYYVEDYYYAKDYDVQTEYIVDTEDYIVYGDTNSPEGLIFYPMLFLFSDNDKRIPISDEELNNSFKFVK